MATEHEALRKLGLLRFHLRNQIKHDQGLMEFDDLILSAKNLLEKSEARDYVAFMLDARIEHLLVDEAQDTGPNAWGIINVMLGNMLEEMEKRSAFVVGDVKQSIYGFQGARPELMLQVRDAFMGQMDARSLPAKSLPMPISFRSAGAILGFVDKLFADPQDMARVAGSGGQVGHEAFQDKFGRVDLWPLPMLPEDAELDPWEDPVNRYGRASPSVILAESMADWLQEQLTTDRPECGGGRLRPKDVFLCPQTWPAT
jgi:ATP-dependent exoDNAse (exonuclease V) beta subunit (contains helicase and exonuclease domains)